ncbi:hypothetical protein ACFLYP_00525 [Chloroflexota bacterium]
MIDLSTKQQHQPLLGSRRGELTAWSLAAVIIIPLVLMRSRLPQAYSVAWIMFAFFVISGILISLGNWIDRRTTLSLEVEGITFSNGIRQARISWGEIKRVVVHPTRLGDKINVYGKENLFSFKTLGEFVVRGEVRDRVGFEKGDQILASILEKSGLAGSKKQAEGYYYYSSE